MLQGLELVPPRTVSYRGTIFEELDADAVAAARPRGGVGRRAGAHERPGRRARQALGGRASTLLSAGVEVITTVNVQHLESLNDVVADVTGVRQRETVPDWVVDLADQVELVDMSPHALQRRMLHGNVYPDPAKAELALQRYFTTDNLTALRELALMRVANQVDETLLSRWSKGRTPETRDRVAGVRLAPELGQGPGAARARGSRSGLGATCWSCTFGSTTTPRRRRGWSSSHAWSRTSAVSST